jgi:spore coat polysaccharide biosynthesis protein SpsF
MQETKKNLQVDVIVEARMSSMRLPGKIMLPAIGKPMLELMVERLKRIKGISNIIIATTVNDTDDCLADFASSFCLGCYRGSEDDVLLRVVQAAQKFDTDIIVEIPSDDPLVDPEISSKVVEAFMERYPEIDLVANDLMETVPVGFYTRAFKRSQLERIEKTTEHPLDRENVEAYFYNNLDQFKHHNIKLDPSFRRSDIRLTLDTEDDYFVIKAVYENIYHRKKDFSLKDIIAYLDANPKIRDTNGNVIQRSFKHD